MSNVDNNIIKYYRFEQKQTILLFLKPNFARDNVHNIKI